MDGNWANTTTSEQGGRGRRDVDGSHWDLKRCKVHVKGTGKLRHWKAIEAIIQRKKKGVSS